MRSCLFCQKQFKPKSPKHMFCTESHCDLYNKGKSWNNYYKSLLTHSKSDRKKLSVKFLLKLHEKQNGLCKLSGVELTKLTGKGQVATNASIDKINPKKGYTPNNVRLLCSFVNSFRSNLDDKSFVWWCDQVRKYNGRTKT